MFDKLTALEEKYNELERSIADPAVAADPEEIEVGKSHAELLPIVTAYRHYRQLESDLETAKELYRRILLRKKLNCFSRGSMRYTGS